MASTETPVHRRTHCYCYSLLYLVVIIATFIPHVSGARLQFPLGRGRGAGPRSAAAADVGLLLTSTPPAAGRAASTFSETSPRCVLIPFNLTACRRFGYTQMRLPNLLNHTTVDELLGTDGRPSWSRLALHVSAAAAELPLFLCSLLTPVCLDRPIRPCASLCRRARTSSEQVLLDAGLAWPDELECELFPSDDEVCIGTSTRAAAAEVDGGRLNAAGAHNVEVKTETLRSPSAHSLQSLQSLQSATTPPLIGRSTLSRKLFTSPSQRREHLKTPKASYKSTGAAKCSVCDQLHSIGDELFDLLCEADFVAKIRPDRYIRAGSNLKIVARKATRFYKLNQPSTSPGGLSSSSVNYNHRRVSFFIPNGAKCDCLLADGTQSPESPSLLVVGKIEHRRQDRLVITGAMPFQPSRLAVRRILREVRDPIPQACDIAADDPRTSDDEEMPPRRRSKPKRKMSKAQRLEQRRNRKKNGGDIDGDNEEEEVNDGVGQRGRRMKAKNGKGGARKNVYPRHTKQDAVVVGGNRGLKQKAAEQQRKQRLKERRRGEAN